MKTLNCLSGLMICTVLLTLGCARTNDPSVKPVVKSPTEEPAKPSSPSAPSTDALDLAGGTTSVAQLPAGTLTTPGAPAPVSGAQPTSAAPSNSAHSGAITQDEVLNFVDSLNLPAVVPFVVPKFTDKERVRFLVGNACAKIVTNAKKIGGTGNLASKLPGGLCNTLPLQLGNPQVTVVPGKLISRKTLSNRIFDSRSEDVVVLLRANGTVAAIKTKTASAGFFSKSAHERVEIGTPQGVSLIADKEESNEQMTLENKDRSLRYEAKTRRATRYTPTTTEKSLVMKSYKGMNLSVIEKSETQYSTAAGRVVRASVTCNIMALDKDLATTLSASIEGRCFHRK